ncbi:hypothetical protein ACFOOM_22670 [Streptomyces echinoruber]|uniref:hypothetical protein n=1 Tax=Streptomyces echinoruber TaxID=68898 RepID=UPI00167E9BA1|nr:hypothetical protein [Streptomyces echinoruber]
MTAVDTRPGAACVVCSPVRRPVEDAPADLFRTLPQPTAPHPAPQGDLRRPWLAARQDVISL